MYKILKPGDTREEHALSYSHPVATRSGALMIPREKEFSEIHTGGCNMVGKSQESASQAKTVPRAQEQESESLCLGGYVFMYSK